MKISKSEDKEKDKESKSTFSLPKLNLLRPRSATVSTSTGEGDKSPKTSPKSSPRGGNVATDANRLAAELAKEAQKEGQNLRTSETRHVRRLSGADQTAVNSAQSETSQHSQQSPSIPRNQHNTNKTQVPTATSKTATTQAHSQLNAPSTGHANRSVSPNRSRLPTVVEGYMPLNFSQNEKPATPPTSHFELPSDVVIGGVVTGFTAYASAPTGVPAKSSSSPQPATTSSSQVAPAIRHAPSPSTPSIVSSPAPLPSLSVSSQPTPPSNPSQFPTAYATLSTPTSSLQPGVNAYATTLVNQYVTSLPAGSTEAASVGGNSSFGTGVQGYATIIAQPTNPTPSDSPRDRPLKEEQKKETGSKQKNPRYKTPSLYAMLPDTDDESTGSSSTKSEGESDSDSDGKELTSSTPRTDNAPIMDWNKRFQLVLNQDNGLAKWTELAKTAHDFAYMAKTYGRIIISERFLAGAGKTVKTVSIGGLAGGDKYICQGILFKFALDTKIAGTELWMYGGKQRSDSKATKAAGHDLSGLMAYYNTHTPGLYYPLMALIDYRGYRLIAQSLLPVDKTTIKYGSCDGGATVHADDPELNEKMKQAAQQLNIKGHLVYGKEIYGAGDTEGHIGKDNKFYVLDFARCFPPEAPRVYDRYDRSVFFKQLRPEFVRSYKSPLSSDAFTMWGADRYAEHNKDVLEATDYLHNVVVTQFGKKLDSMNAEGLRLIEEMHREGINVRLLGRLHDAVKCPKVRKLIVTEMIVRVLKEKIRALLRREMRKVRVPVEEPYRRVTLRFLNKVVDRSDSSIWVNDIQLGLASKFDWQFGVGSLLGKTESQSNPAVPPESIRDYVDIRDVLQRLEELAGIRLNREALAQLARNPANFTFHDADLVKMTAKVKHLNIVDEASAKGLFLEAIHTTGSQSDRLWDLANQKFARAVASTTYNYDTMLSWGMMLYEQGKRKSDKEGGDSILQSALSKFQAVYEINPRCEEALYHWSLCLFESAKRKRPTTFVSGQLFQQACEVLVKLFELNAPPPDPLPPSIATNRYWTNLTDLAVSLRTKAVELLELASKGGGGPNVETESFENFMESILIQKALLALKVEKREKDDKLLLELLFSTADVYREILDSPLTSPKLWELILPLASQYYEAALARVNRIYDERSHYTVEDGRADAALVSLTVRISVTPLILQSGVLSNKGYVFEINREHELPFTLWRASETAPDGVTQAVAKEVTASHWENLLQDVEAGSKNQGKPNSTTLVWYYEVDRFYLTGVNFEFASHNYLIRPARIMLFLSHTEPKLSTWQAFDSLQTSTDGAKNMVAIYNGPPRDSLASAPLHVELKINPPRIGKFLIIKMIPYPDSHARGDTMSVKRIKVFGYQAPMKATDATKGSTVKPQANSGKNHQNRGGAMEMLQWLERNRQRYFDRYLGKGKSLAQLLRISTHSPTLRMLLRAHLAHKYGETSSLKDRPTSKTLGSSGGAEAIEIHNTGRGIELPKGSAFDFSGCSREVNDEVIDFLIQTCRGIRVLNLADCSQLSGEKVQLLLRNNSALLGLNLQGVQGLNDSTVTCLQENCTSLEVLIVWKDISENAISQLNLSGLTALDLSNCKNLKDKGLSDLVRNNTLLKHFNIAGCEVTDKSFQKMEKDKRNFINLLSLVADCCFHLPSSSFLQLTSHCRHLRTLSLAGNTQNPLSITDETIVTISSNLGTSLQEINLYRNFQLTDKAVIAIAHNCTQLSAISLAHCKGITDAAVIELAKRSTTLTVVNLTNTGITDKPVRLLVRRHPKLQTLILEWCQKVGDKAVKSIIKHGKFIETLTLTGLYNISDEVLLQLGKLSETLVFLEISWLKKPPSVIALLRSRLPKTKVGAGEFRSNMSSTFLRIGW